MLPSLHIETNDAEIGLHSQRPPMQIKQEQAELRIKQKHVDIIEISKTASQLYIDQTEAFADANLKSPLRMANEFWQKTKGEVLNYLAKTVQEGDEMMRIENGGGAIPRIAAQNSQITPSETTLAYMPRSMSQVKFSYVPSELTIKAPYDEPEITVTLRPPQIEIPTWQTNAYIKQKNRIHIEVVGANVDKTY